MYLKSLELKNYRNYDHIDLEFDKNSILIVGNNGNGKTNLLEAIYYLSTGCSHRTHIQDELLKWGRGFSLIRANIYSGSDQKKFLVEIEIRNSNVLKIKVNGVYYKKKKDFVSILPSVIFSPDDLRIIKSNPGERRAFLDSILEKIYGDFSSLRLQYQKILMQRNSLLKSAGGRLSNNHLETIDTWNDNLVKYGIEIILKRYKLLDSIKTGFAGHIENFFKGVVPDIKYVFSWNRNEKEESHDPEKYLAGNKKDDSDIVMDREFLKKEFKKRLTENLDIDLARKTTSLGPHRDDFIIYFNGRDIRSYGSQGQQRIASISLKLCELQTLRDRLKTDPVLLLDDVLSELDIRRRRRLVKIISGRFQTFVTATNISYLDKLDIDFGSRFLVRDNNIIGMKL